jgi:uncharacterized protein YcbX
MTGKRAQSIVSLKIKKFGTNVTQTREGFANADVVSTLRVMVLPIEPEAIAKLQTEAGANVEADKARNFVIKGTDDVREDDLIDVFAALQLGVSLTERYRIVAVTPIVMQNVLVFLNAVGRREA